MALVFNVHRREPELIRPAKPTPREFKLLSDIDDQEGLRFHIPLIQFYKHQPSMQGRDPVAVIWRALAETLVHYYPLAGRMREGPNRKLMVECTGEGVLFIEADADVRLAEFGDQLQPPFPCLEELLFDVPGSNAVLHAPLVLIQVTRLRCSGFIFALRLLHSISDAQGLLQFIFAVSEIARGANSPSIIPVWERQVLNTRSPSRVTCIHREYVQKITINDTTITMPLDFDCMTQRSFFFGRSEISSIRCHVPRHLRRSYSRFEFLAACLWKCRTAALQPKPEEEMQMVCVVNVREKLHIPRGYYGNALAFPMAVSSAGNLCQNPLGYALDLVRKAKGEVTKEYMKSVADLMVLNGRPKISMTKWTYSVSDVTQARFGTVDFGWGEAEYSGFAMAHVGPVPGVGNLFIPCKNKEGESGIALVITLSMYAMERFSKELESMLNKVPDENETKKFTFIVSSL